MSAIGDLFSFTDFARRDAWKQLGDDPERIFIGAIDPASSWAWGKITGKNYEPVLNVFGSPMGGGSLGTDRSGGVYERAENKGYNTYPAQNFYGIGDAVAGFFGGSALSGIGSAGSASSSAGANAGNAAANSSSAASPSVATQFASHSANASNAGAQGTTLGSQLGTGGMNGINYAKVAQNAAGLLGGVGGQKQQPSVVPIQPQQMKSNDQNTQKLQIAVKLQSLRMKPGKTQQEYQLMQQLQAALNGHS